MRASVIVVTWNGLHVLKDCVAALAAQTQEHELVVVDNGSTDGTRDWLRAHAPRASLITLTHNLGFAGGNNVGIRAARGDHLILINNDAIPAPDFVERLTAPFEHDSQLGSTAGVLTFAHQPDVVASAGIAVSRDGLHRDLHAFAPVDALPDAATPIFGASGGAVCYRREALEDVGLFDDRYFAYLEDADLAWRLRLRGWGCMLAPGAQARHIYSATAGQGTPFKQRLQARNRLRVIIRCFPARIVREFWPAMARYDLLAAGYAILKRQPAILAGRLSIIPDLPNLLGQRRRLQAHKRVSSESLLRWFSPAATVREMLDEQRQLGAILAAA